MKNNQKEVTAMNCRRVCQLLIEYIENDLPLEISAKIDDHLRECKSCSREFTRIQKTINLIRKLPSITPAPGITQEVMAKLEEEPTDKRFIDKFTFFSKRLVVAGVTLALIFCVLYGTMTLFVRRSSFSPFQTWVATVQAVPFDLKETGWWISRKLPADERLAYKDKYVGVVFGGILDHPTEVDFLVKWIRPDGEIFKETVWKGRVSTGLCSFMSDLAIDDYKLRDEKKEVTEAAFTGEIVSWKQEGRMIDFRGSWRLEIYINKKYQMAFQIEV